MRKKGLICGLLALTLVLSACAKKSESSAPQAAGSTNSKASMDMAMNNTASKSEEKPKATASEAQTEVKKIIMNGTIYIVEENLSKLSEAIHKKAEELGGYVEGENVWEERLTTTVRIPSAKFEEFMSYTEKGFSVKNKSISSQNITDAYVDNEARLKNLRAQEDQVLTILKKANTVEEVLKVQAELYKIRGEAEALEARKKTWDKQVDYATLIINADKKIVVPENKNTILGGSEFFKAIGKGFNNTSITLVLFIQHILIFIFSNIIVLAILALAAFLGFKKYKKSIKKN
jgi:hypothetical protein